jgi:hypothetical protein
MLYEKLFDKLEKVRWNMGEDIPWQDARPDLITPFQKKTIENICKTEIGSLFATEAFIRDFYDDIDFSCFVSVWYYEEMKHCLALKKYMSVLGVDVTADDFQKMRMTIPPYDKHTILMIHFISEHKLAMWYTAFSKWLKCPVAVKLFKHISDDEIRHGQAYFEFIKRDIKRDPKTLLSYMRSALFMMRPSAPADTHAVTITGTTDLLDEPHYILDVDKDMLSEEDKAFAQKRIYTLLSNLADEAMTDYTDLSTLVRTLKKSA